MGIEMIVKDVIHIPADSEEEKARLHAKTQTGKSNPFLTKQYAIPSKQFLDFLNATD